MKPAMWMRTIILGLAAGLMLAAVACAAGQSPSARVRLIPGTAQAVSSITQTVRARLTPLFADPYTRPATDAPASNVALESIVVAGEAVTVVLRLASPSLDANSRSVSADPVRAEPVRAEPVRVVNSDGLTRQVIDALLDLPIRQVHLLAVDASVPGQTPRPLHTFAPSRPIETKPVLSGAEDTHLPAPTTNNRLSVASSDAAAQQAAGGLSGKSVYVSAGHGWYFHPDPGWRTQRGVSNGIVEDHNNAEAVNQYLIAYLRRAGADVFPTRDPAMIDAELVIDNENIGGAYIEAGTWYTSALAGYRGGSYRYAVSVAAITPTAVATWSAPVMVSGRYPVYAWYVPAANRVPQARYRIIHAGGASEVIISQQTHGYTWRYLGAFYFRAGDVAQVVVSNASSLAGMAVIADAIRLGGGVGDIVRGPGPGLKPRWEEAARYWAMLLGAPASVYDSREGEMWCDTLAPDACDDITARPRYADWENIGTGDDAVFVSWHSNASSGNARGTVSFVYNNDPDPPYNQWVRLPGALELQSAVHSRVIQAIRNGWDSSWHDFGQWQANLGEVRETRSMPAMLIEMAFHDNINDAAQLREPRFAQLLARAVYQGIVAYYAQKDGVTPRYLPEPPEQLAVRNMGGGALAVSWQAPATFALGMPTDPAQRYRIYTSSDGFAWDNGREVTGLSAVLGGYSNGQVIYVRVTAINDGGESFPTPALAARVGPAPRVLVVHGFDSLDASMRLIEGAATRMILDRMNRYNYAVQHATAITEAFDSAVRQAVASGAVSLTGYRLVDWFAGMQTAKDGVFDPAERAALRQFVSQPRRVLLVSGSNVAAWLSGADPAFLRDILGAQYVADSALSYQAIPVSPGLFAGLPSFSIDDGTHGTYNAWSNDVIAPAVGATSVLVHASSGSASVSRQHPSQTRVVFLSFPLETVYPDSARSALMARVVSFLGAPPMAASPYKVFLPLVSMANVNLCESLINGGFETDAAWQINPTPWPATYTTAPAWAGQRSMRAGVPFDVPDPGVLAFSSVSQTVTLPSGALWLSVWINASTEDDDDQFYIRLWDETGALTTLHQSSAPTGGWQRLVFDLSTWAGQRITLLLGARNDGDGRRSVAWFDEVSMPYPRAAAQD